MSKKLFSLILSILIFFFISNGCSDNSNPQQLVEPIAPENLTGVDIELQNMSGLLILKLNNDGSASLYNRFSLCCWTNYYGNYTYEVEDNDTGVISVIYTYAENVSNGEIISSYSIDMYVEYIVDFDDEVSGSYTEISGGDVLREGKFTVEVIE